MVTLKQRQTGSILFICLFIIIIISVITASAISSSVLQERVTGNLLDQTRSELVAETTLPVAALKLLNYRDDNDVHVYSENGMYGTYTFKRLGSSSYSSSLGNDKGTYGYYNVKVVGYGRSGETSDTTTTINAIYMFKD